MKQFITIIILSLIMGCANFQFEGPVTSKFCPAPEGTQSFICEKSEELGVTPEQVYGWIFSAAAIAAVTDAVEIKWMCDFKDEVADWYLKMYPVTYDSVVTEVISQMNLIDDPRKLLLIKNILNQHFTIYSSPDLISKYDDLMLRAGSNKFSQDMMCR